MSDLWTKIAPPPHDSAGAAGTVAKLYAARLLTWLDDRSPREPEAAGTDAAGRSTADTSPRLTLAAAAAVDAAAACRRARSHALRVGRPTPVALPRAVVKIAGADGRSGDAHAARTY